MGWYDDDYVTCSSVRKIGKPMGPCAPHYPNKAERVLLTQMMQKSGKTEAEIREDKSNRIKLSAAQKSMSQGKGKNGGSTCCLSAQNQMLLFISAFQYGTKRLQHIWKPVIMDIVVPL